SVSGQVGVSDGDLTIPSEQELAVHFGREFTRIDTNFASIAVGEGEKGVSQAAKPPAKPPFPPFPCLAEQFTEMCHCQNRSNLSP
ncbi:MAG: hypothetical protein JW900_05140, partial [Anaerolineae bacterium]|nr:hypothetical protein [Anaerolineae bacterium]